MLSVVYMLMGHMAYCINKVSYHIISYHIISLAEIVLRSETVIGVLNFFACDICS